METSPTISIPTMPKSSTSPPGRAIFPRASGIPKPSCRPSARRSFPPAINLSEVRRQIDPGPAADAWRDLPAGGSVEDAGIFDRRYVYFRAKLPATTQPGTSLSLFLPGQDSIVAQVNEDRLAIDRYGRGTLFAPLPQTTKSENNLLVLYENGGRDNGGPGLDYRCGPKNAAITTNTAPSQNPLRLVPENRTRRRRQ